jgi:hypothetical protein
MRFAWGALLAGVAACGGGGPRSEGAPGAAAEVWCRGLCSAARRCRVDDANCEVQCTKARPGLVVYSVEGARAFEPCLSRLDCRVFSSDAAWYAALDACWDEATAQVQITSDARTLCVDYAEAWFECGDSSSVAECEQIQSMFSPTVLDALHACTGKPTCTALASCVTAAYGGS